MTDLASKTCVPCRGDEPPLEGEDLKRHLNKIQKGWEKEDSPDRIVKEFEFEDFKAAVSFVNKVAELAEEEGHHPNIYIHSYNKVKIELWTHKIAGLHENDFIMAAKIEKLL